MLSGGTNTAWDGTLNSPSFSPNGSYFAFGSYESGSSGGVTIFSATGGTLSGQDTFSLNGNDPVGVAFSPTGSSLVVANQITNTVGVYTFSAGTLTNYVSYVLPSSSSNPAAIAFSPDGSYLACANEGSNDVTIFNTSAWCPTPAPTSTTSGATGTTSGSSPASSSSSGCSTGCIAGISVGVGIPVLVAAAVGGFFIRKYYCTGDDGNVGEAVKAPGRDYIPKEGEGSVNADV